MPPTETPTIDIGEPMIIFDCDPGAQHLDGTRYPPSPCPTEAPPPSSPTRQPEVAVCESMSLDTGNCNEIAVTGINPYIFLVAALLAFSVGMITIIVANRKK